MPHHHTQHPFLIQPLISRNQLPTTQLKPSPHLAPHKFPLQPLTSNNNIHHAHTVPVPHYPDIAGPTGQNSAGRRRTDAPHAPPGDTHHGGVGPDTTTADPDPHTIDLIPVLPIQEEGWIRDEAQQAPEAGGTPDEGHQVIAAALHHGRAGPLHQGSGCSLPTSYANNFSA